MQAWKCDRCEKLYVNADTKERVLNRPRLEGIDVQGIAFGTVSYSMSDTFVHKDLCEDCARDFVLWYKEPALAGITNDEKL